MTTPANSKKHLRRMALALCLALLAVPVAVVSYASGSERPLGLLFTPYRGGDLLDSSDVIFQKGARACGIAVIQMFLSLDPADARTERLLGGLRPAENGISLRAMQEVAWKAGNRAEAWYVAPAELETLRVPAVGLLDQIHYVLVEEVDAEGGVVFVDPSFGRLRLGLERFRQLWSGPALIPAGRAPAPVATPGLQED
jgi:predicted double-glycine peptidase